MKKAFTLMKKAFHCVLRISVTLLATLERSGNFPNQNFMQAIVSLPSNKQEQTGTNLVQLKQENSTYKLLGSSNFQLCIHFVQVWKQ